MRNFEKRFLHERFLFPTWNNYFFICLQSKDTEIHLAKRVALAKQRIGEKEKTRTMLIKESRVTSLRLEKLFENAANDSENNDYNDDNNNNNDDDLATKKKRGKNVFYFLINFILWAFGFCVIKIAIDN